MGLGTKGLANFANTETGDAFGLGASTHSGGAIGEGIGGAGVAVRYSGVEPTPSPSPSPSPGPSPSGNPADGYLRTVAQKGASNAEDGYLRTVEEKENG